jgi:hypothetical protein
MSVLLQTAITAAEQISSGEKGDKAFLNHC